MKRTLCVKGWKLLDKLKTETFPRKAGIEIYRERDRHTDLNKSLWEKRKKAQEPSEASFSHELSDQNDFFWSFTLRNSSKNRRDDLQLSLKSEADLREHNQGEEAAIMISGVKDLCVAQLCSGTLALKRAGLAVDLSRTDSICCVV